MNVNHKQSITGSLTLQSLVLAGMLVTPTLVYAEQVNHSYDDLNRLIKSDYGNGNVIDYTYDAAGNRTSQKETTTSAPNQSPTANAGKAQTVRQGSLVTLSGSGIDPDNGPSPLSYAWNKTAGPTVNLNGATTAQPKFTPSVKGLYTFGLVVNDGLANSPVSSVNITVPTLGDIDLDGDVDNNDLAKITASLNKPTNDPNDLRDINGDIKIDALDARKLVLLCTRLRCAIQ